MCLKATVEGHTNFRATLAIAQDRTRPLPERQTACQAAMGWGIVSTPHPRDVEPEPFCLLINEGRMEAYKLWTEELSYQAQRALRRRATESTTVGD